MTASVVSILALVAGIAALAINLRTLYRDIWRAIEGGLAAHWRQFDEPTPIVVTFKAKGG